MANVRFVEALPLKQFRAREWDDEGNLKQERTSSIGTKVAAAGMYPFSLLGRLLELNAWSERGRWRRPQSGLARYVIDSVIGLLGGITLPAFAFMACMVVLIGAWKVSSFFVVDVWGSLAHEDWAHADIESYFAHLVSVTLTLVVIALSVLLALATLLGVAANYVLHRASRRILYGLITTYVAGPGAPEWVAAKKNIITLPIPQTVTVSSFAMPAKERRALIKSAREVTLARLTKLLSQGSLQGEP